MLVQVLVFPIIIKSILTTSRVAKLLQVLRSKPSDVGFVSIIYCVGNDALFTCTDITPSNIQLHIKVGVACAVSFVSLV